MAKIVTPLLSPLDTICHDWSVLVPKAPPVRLVHSKCSINSCVLTNSPCK